MAEGAPAESALADADAGAVASEEFDVLADAGAVASKEKPNKLLQFMQNASLSDCEVKAGEQIFKCHKVVLCACSTYFYEKFITANSQEQPLLLPTNAEVNMAKAFTLVLKYAYNDQNWASIEEAAGALQVLPENNECLGLLVASAILGIDTLAAKTMEILLPKLDGNSVVQTLATVARLGTQAIIDLDKVNSKCIQVLKRDFESVYSNKQDLRLLATLRVDFLSDLLKANDLQVTQEHTVLETVKEILKARSGPSNGEKPAKLEGDAEAEAGAEGDAGNGLSEQEQNDLLSTIRFHHLGHQELLLATKDPILTKAGAQERVLKALSAKLDKTEHEHFFDKENVEEPRPSTMRGNKLASLSLNKKLQPSPLPATPGARASQDAPKLFQRITPQPGQSFSPSDLGQTTCTGALHFLGTQGGQSAWCNPMGLSHVLAFSSGLSFGKIEDLVGGGSVGGVRQQVNIRSNNIPNSFFGVDLQSDRLLMLTGYCLKNRNSTSHCLVSWVIEGSMETRYRPSGLNTLVPQASDQQPMVNGQLQIGCSTIPKEEGTWEILDTRQDTTSLRKEDVVMYFDVPADAQGGAYRCFRVRQTSANSSGSDNLVLGGFELYGKAVGGTWP